MSHEVRRKIFERDYTAVLLPFNPVRDEAMLIEQIRVAVYDTSKTSWLLEMVAKVIEESESVKDAAHREATEEAGLIVKQTKPVLSFLASPGGTSKYSSIMVGEVDVTTTNGIRGLADENENIRAHMVSRKQAYQRVGEGKINNTASVVVLRRLQLHHQTLRSEWA